MIIGLGIFLWLLSLLLAARLACLGREDGLSRRLRAWLWIALGLGAAALLFRPHEDIFGGEDPGSYINSGIAYGRQQQFFAVDPLLARVPPEIRPDFYYGHSGYGLTKDACLWVRDPERAVTGPHFQPAYPLLIALVSRLAEPSWALYVIPLFTLFLALALRALATLLLPYRLAGLIAFLVFLLNPLTLWHGRCSRPEIIAGFMFFGGAALLLNAWQGRRWSRWPDLALGALAVSLAPFFHITAGYLLIPAAGAAALVILRGRDDFLIYPPAALAGLVLLACQIIYITDYYGVGRLLHPLLCRPVLALSLFAAGFILLAAGCWWSRRVLARRAAENTTPPAPVSLGWSLGFAAASALFILHSAVTRDAAGSLPLLGRPIENYLYLADFKTFANMVSLPSALLALLGWLVWLTGPSERRGERVVLAMAVLPAIVFSSSIRDFMMTRYWFPALIPMCALGLAALAGWLTYRARSAWVAVACTAVIIMIGSCHRTHLARVTEYRGLSQFLKPYAEIVKSGRGILLCEYSRLAAPLEHGFGIPTLGLDNERRNDYARAEQAWETIMKNHPDVPAFFATPFHAPLSDRFDFHLARDAEFHGDKLLQARQGLPTRIVKYDLRLRLYRMSLKGAGPPHDFSPSPEHYRLDSGNMGMRRFANTRNEHAVFRIVNGDLPCLTDYLARIDIRLANASPDDTLAAAHPAALSNAMLTLALTNPPYLELSGFVTNAGAPYPNPLDGFLLEHHQLTLAFAARWTRGTAELLVPPSFPGGYFVLLAVTPRLGDGQAMRVGVSLGSARLAELTPEPDCWQWHLIPLPAAAAGQWLTIAAEPAWNCGLAGYPSDLGILAGHISFWPRASE